MYEVFKQLLQSYGISAYKFSQDTGISQSTISTWKKKNNVISGDIAKTIADYFNVTVDYLMGINREKPQYYLNEETAAIAQEVFENKDLKLLFDASRNSRPEDIRLAAEMLQRMKDKENYKE
jgi:Helix-turn-helix.